jgi:hypothetical protein
MRVSCRDRYRQPEAKFRAQVFPNRRARDISVRDGGGIAPAAHETETEKRQARGRCEGQDTVATGLACAAALRLRYAAGIPIPVDE